MDRKSAKTRKTNEDQRRDGGADLLSILDGAADILDQLNHGALLQGPALDAIVELSGQKRRLGATAVGDHKAEPLLSAADGSDIQNLNQRLQIEVSPHHCRDRVPRQIHRHRSDEINRARNGGFARRDWGNPEGARSQNPRNFEGNGPLREREREGGAKRGPLYWAVERTVQTWPNPSYPENVNWAGPHRECSMQLVISSFPINYRTKLKICPRNQSPPPPPSC